jgi:hypothetical protein
MNKEQLRSHEFLARELVVDSRAADEIRWMNLCVGFAHYC